MKKFIHKKMIYLLVGSFLLIGCNTEQKEPPKGIEAEISNEEVVTEMEQVIRDAVVVVPNESIQELEPDMSMVRFDGNDGFTTFLEKGGAKSDGEVVQYLAGNMLQGVGGLAFEGTPFGCSTIASSNAEGEALFGRNFDWYNCKALIVASYPEDAYASLSTVNTDFISQGAGALSVVLSADNIMKIVALYAPIDGMNDQGLSVSVNMIQDSDTIEQNTDKPDITTTTAVRLLLNQAADVEEAIALLRQYDLHASFGFMVHFAIADTKGNSVAVEYVNNEMVVTDTPVVTNYYLAEGEKNGIGTRQSHERYDILMQVLKEQENMSEVQMRDALERVSKHHYNDGETTEWSAIFNQTTGEALYYHRENFDTAYRISLDK